MSEINLLTTIPDVPDRTKDAQGTFNAKTVAWMAAQKENTDDFNANVPALNELFTKADQALDAADESRENAAVATLKAGEAAASAQSALESKEAAQTARTGAEAACTGAEAARDAAVAVAGVDIATTGKAGLVKPDGKTTEIGSDGTLSVPKFAGSSAGLVPVATSADAQKMLRGDGTWGYVEDATASMTISADLHLTVDSPRTLVLSATAPGLSVRLPDHKTLTRDPVFHIFVRDSEDIQLCDFTGQPIKAHPVLSEYTATRIQLIDATAGLWALANYNKIDMSDAPAPLGTLSLSDQIIVNSTSRTYRTKMHVLSENSAIVVYENGSSNYVVILSITGTDIVVGGTYRINNLGDFRQCDIAKLSANKVLVSIMDDSNYLYALVMTISGTTITIGTHKTITSSKVGDNFNMRSVALSANKVLLYYTTSDGGTMHYDILSSSDTNEVIKLKSRTGGNNQHDMVAVSENTIFGIYSGGSTQTIFKINIAEDNTITFNDVLRIYEPVMNIVSMTAISEEKFLIAYSNANNAGCVKVVTLNGSGPELICTTSTTLVENSSITSLSKKTAVVCFYGPNYPSEVYALRVNQNTIAVTDKKVLSGKITYGLSMNRLSSNRALLAYHNEFKEGSTTYNKTVARTLTLY